MDRPMVGLFAAAGAAMAAIVSLVHGDAAGAAIVGAAAGAGLAAYGAIPAGHQEVPPAPQPLPASPVGLEKKDSKKTRIGNEWLTSGGGHFMRPV
jgi:hypothetical protein